MTEVCVEKSISGLTWRVKSAEDRVVLQMVQKYDLPEMVARILAGRGFCSETVGDFLNPTLKKNLPNPFTLKDMERAAERVSRVVLAGEPIGIMGDYDVDGATSTAILKMFLKSCGIRVLTFVPNREDGYGPNAKKMIEYRQAGCSVVLTADCGMTAFEPIDVGTKSGLDVIVLDHHEPEKTLPNAYAVVNPKRLDEPVSHPCHHLAACGVVFLFVVALNQILRKKGFYQNRPEPNLMQYLDLVALGTVCDVVKLQGVNRLLVKAGLKQMQKRENIGLVALSDKAGLDKAPAAYHLGFVFGPRINACGRVGQSDLGMQLLSETDKTRAAVLAEQLEELNLMRRDIEAEVLELAVHQVEQRTEQLPFIVVEGENWHQGVVGIVAGRLKDRYNLPVFALSIEGDDVKGSSRSVPGVDLGTLVINAIGAGVLDRGGGHPMAAGFSLKKEKLPAFKAYLKEHIQNTDLKNDISTLDVDAVMDVGGVTQNFMQSVARLEPFGESNPEPCFVLKNVTVSHVTVLKNGHVACSFTGKNGKYISGIAFRVEDKPIGRFLKSALHEQCHVAGFLKMDTWKGKTKIQIQIQDIALA